MATESLPGSDEFPDAQTLLEIVDTFRSVTAIGFEPAHEGMNVHIKELYPDDRSAAGDLFGFRAPESWHAVGMKLSGRAISLAAPDRTAPEERHPDSGDNEISSSILLVRTGEFASKMNFEGTEHLGCWPAADHSPEAPQGVCIDALHRVMGLPSPGEEPPLALLSLSLWLDAIMTVLADEGTITWARAAATELSYPGSGKSDTSVTQVAEAIWAEGAAISWDRLRVGAVHRKRTSSQLLPEEMEWMDSTMYGRWAMSCFPDFDLVVAAMTAAGCEGVANRVSQVIDEVRDASSRPDEWLYRRRSA